MQSSLKSIIVYYSPQLLLFDCIHLVFFQILHEVHIVELYFHTIILILYVLTSLEVELKVTVGNFKCFSLFDLLELLSGLF